MSDVRSIYGIEIPAWFRQSLMERFGEITLNGIHALLLEDYLKRNSPKGPRIDLNPVTLEGRVLNFGKYKGVPLKFVPTDYLDWCIENMKFKDADLKADMEAELNKRSEPSDDTDARPIPDWDPDDEIPF